MRIAPDKIRVNLPLSYLGRVLNTHTVSHAPLLTLNDFQKLLGDINWICPHLKLTTADLKPLFDCLKGHPDPSSKRKLTSEVQSALVKVDEALNDQLIRINITRGWDLIILTKTYTYRMLVERRPIGMAPSTSEPKKNSFVLSQLGGTINRKDRKRSVELFGKEVENVVIPFNNDQLQFL